MEVAPGYKVPTLFTLFWSKKRLLCLLPYDLAIQLYGVGWIGWMPLDCYDYSTTRAPVVLKSKYRGPYVAYYSRHTKKIKDKSESKVCQIYGKVQKT